ncbi:MAG: hypothetical protein ACHP6H_02115 [Legionellales bacterium]
MAINYTIGGSAGKGKGVACSIVGCGAGACYDTHSCCAGAKEMATMYSPVHGAAIISVAVNQIIV